ncbi:MAG: hypothetical protein ACE5IY_23935, partial [bacterium]
LILLRRQAVFDPPLVQTLDESEPVPSKEGSGQISSWEETENELVHFQRWASLELVLRIFLRILLGDADGNFALESQAGSRAGHVDPPL